VAPFGFEIEQEDDLLSASSSSLRSIEDLEFCPHHQKEACIIFDWDDTLMCSSAIKSRRDPDPGEVKQLAEAVESVLRVAMDLGRTAIVTNANLTWVRTTAGIFMPSVVPLLDLVELVSARQSYSRRWPGDHSAWKRCAFRDIVSRKDGEVVEASTGGEICEPHSGVNLVVVGDSAAEIQAGRSVVQGNSQGDAIVKTVKLKEAPTVGELRGQLQALARSLRRIVIEDRSSSKFVVRGGSSTCGWSVRDASCGLSLWNLAS